MYYDTCKLCIFFNVKATLKVNSLNANQCNKNKNLHKPMKCLSLAL